MSYAKEYTAPQIWREMLDTIAECKRNTNLDKSAISVLNTFEEVSVLELEKSRGQ